MNAMRDGAIGRADGAVSGAVVMTPEAYDRLVAAMYAARDEDDWRAPMAELARAAGAAALQLVCVQSSSRQVVVSVAVGACAASRAADWLPDGQTKDQSEGQSQGSRQRALWAMKEGDCLSIGGDLAGTYPATDRWWHETVKAARAAEAVVVRLLDRPGLSAWVLVMRTAMAPALAAETAQWLHRAKAHLTQALQLQLDALRRPVLRNGARAARRLSDQLLDQLCHAVMLVSGDGAIRYANRRATEALAEGRMIQSREGVLVCPHPVDERQWRSALRRVLGDERGAGLRGEPQGRAVDVRLAAGAGTRVLFISRLSVHGEPVALVIKHDIADVSRHDAALVGRVFNLTPAEARIATLLAQGLTPEQISERSGTTLATVRSQIKALFVKTGTNRQADVVRMVASLPPFESLRGGMPPQGDGVASQGTGRQV